MRIPKELQNKINRVFEEKRLEAYRQYAKEYQEVVVAEWKEVEASQELKDARAAIDVLQKSMKSTSFHVTERSGYTSLIKGWTAFDVEGPGNKMPTYPRESLSKQASAPVDAYVAVEKDLELQKENLLVELALGKTFEDVVAVCKKHGINL
jgi:hypothetical protein